MILQQNRAQQYHAYPKHPPAVNLVSLVQAHAQNLRDEHQHSGESGPIDLVGVKLQLVKQVVGSQEEEDAKADVPVGVGPCEEVGADGSGSPCKYPC